ncbi:MAG: helix-turn-helix transcriptional regulator [Peptococcaceae bacterium]|nr:helix-turn-helix transcriptional regulator [Peptococcaceae bacterium]
MDYYAIGQRIRKVRKAHGLSQEQLAEQVGISKTHMSHIETGNTKLSLPVLVDIARSLHVSTDDLLFEAGNLHTQAMTQEVFDIMNSCTYQQAQVLKELLKTAKTAIEQYV